MAVVAIASVAAAAHGLVMTPPRRAAIVLGTVALVCGVAGLLAARDLNLTEDKGALIFALFRLNALGALVTIVLAIAALVAARSGVRALATAAGSGFALAAVVQLAQVGRETNVLGGRASTLSFFMCMGVGLILVGRHPRWRASD